MSYITLNNLSSNYDINQNSPFTYLLNPSYNASFITGIYAKGTGADSQNYRSYMSDRCSIEGWDSYCEAASIDNNIGVPYNQGDYVGIAYSGLRQGDLLVKSTAEKKYISGTKGVCRPMVQQYDPRMASSPYVATMANCGEKYYDVKEKDLDLDPVMNKLIDKPEIAPHVLFSIYKTRMNFGTMDKLKGTKLYDFFMGSRWKLFRDKKY